jgi:hypothetical protein
VADTRGPFGTRLNDPIAFGGSLAALLQPRHEFQQVRDLFDGQVAELQVGNERLALWDEQFARFGEALVQLASQPPPKQ